MIRLTKSAMMCSEDHMSSTMRRESVVALVLLSCLIRAAANGGADAPAPAPSLHSKYHNLQGKACLAKASGRGAGVAVSSCPNGTERNGALCYHSCSEGYSGVGPVCWKSCPDDTRDVGAMCLATYGKGCCCTVFGCCGGCKEGYKDAGCFCRKGTIKHSYGRGAGTPLRCQSDEEENGALCYKACPQGYSGEGPVCWEDVNPAGFPHRCNGVLYTADRATCVAIDYELAKAGSFTAACVGAATAYAATGAPMLLPAASFLCGKSFDSLVDQVQDILELTQAKSCSTPA